LLHEVELVCDSVAILSKGKLIAQGRVADLTGAQGVVRFRSTDDARAIGILRGLSWVTDARMEGDMVVAAAAPDRSWEITRSLAGAGVYISEMLPARVSLEHYFLEVTGEPARAVPAAI
jgi:ABC-2 type transport system ATP-binding protein